MNVTEITKIIHNKINAATTLEEVLLLSKAMEKISLGNVKIVATFADLNDYFPRFGEMFFVDNENKIYYGYGDNWVSLIEQATDNIIYSMGSNTNGQIGNGEIGSSSIFNKSSPVSLSIAASDWVNVSTGGNHSLAVRANGEAYSWGLADRGRLGNNINSFDNYPIPNQILGNFNDWVKAEAGSSSSAALRANGTIWTWGRNNANLGTGDFVDRSSPVPVIGGISDWVDVSLFDVHVLALRSDGTAWGWGDNGSGRVGNGLANTGEASPVSVVGGFTDWTQLSTGGRHSLGVRANGTAWSWGYGGSSFSGNGALGDGTTLSRSSPVSVVGGFTDWIQVSGGQLHSLGLRANGTAWAWGANVRFGSANGQLGDGTTTNKSSPVSVVGGFTDWTQVSAGFYVGMGVRANGSAWAWGRGSNGYLGDNTTVSKSSPVSIVGGFTDWVSVEGGRITNHAIRSF